MTASLEKRCRELEELLRLAQSENDAITCQAEDTLLLGRVAEVILEEDVDQKIFEKFLERVAILKDLHYGAHFELDSGEFVLREEYAPFLNSTPSGARLALPADIYDAVLNWDEPPGSIAWDVPPGCLTFEAPKPETSAILALPCIIRHRPHGVFLFADNRRNATQLRALLPVLQKMARIVRNRIEQLALLTELSDMNLALEHRVDERTDALAEISRALVEELAGRREAQAELRRAAAALENTTDGVIFADSSQRIVAVNRAFTKVTGYEADEVIGKTPRILQSGRHDPEFYATMWRSIRETARWQGEIWNRRKDGGVYLELLNVSVVRDEAGVVTHYVGVFCDLTAIKDSEARFHHLAHYDALTDLPNWLLFRARVEHAIAQAPEHRLAVLILGVDGFKHLNDSLWHTAADELLRRLAARLRGLNREANTVARRSGDEFGILLERVPDPESVGRAGWNMLEGVASPFEVEGHEAFLTCSAGISLYPDDGTDFTTLLQNAEVALHRAKGSGLNTYQFYTAEMTERARERFGIESDLRRAVQRGEFVLHFQPRFSLGTGELTGVEALTRWQHPERGLVAPESFIPIAEASGLIDSLGAWAVREACHQAAAWQAEALPPFRVAVNLSTREITSSRLVGTVGSALHEAGLAADLLELEITERFLMEQPEAVQDALQELKNLGVTLAIDDFGTGYSSLSYLKIYPVDRLKIDQSFVRDIPFHPDDQAIARAIITLGHGLSLKVIAEGVETADQADFLRTNLCDEAQGFFYSRPMPAAEFGDFLRKRASR
jgi:diguanylate cyclase (GGDEF)-like protein/PAS domain S-box-containing protein